VVQIPVDGLLTDAELLGELPLVNVTLSVEPPDLCDLLIG